MVNNIIGWAICLVACTVYILTAEATASWWDCGEYIATAFKLQVGHPPGAPTFQLFGRIFSMFADPTTAARAVNIMSAVCSGVGIMFLYWTITLLGKLILRTTGHEVSLKDSRTWAVFAAGIVGALCYTFSDTYWFSAVEGEVYAMSSFFTAVVFWAVLKWEEQSDDPHSLRWLILVCFLVGIAIGVHLLNLLTIPAIVYVVYFKKWKQTTTKGFIWSGVISVVLLALVLYGIIPGIVNVDSAFDVFFVNKLHLPFNSGTIFFFVLVAAAIAWGLWYTSARKKNKPVINAAIMGLLMLIVGYSTFFVLVIRANTNTPLNENAPKDAVAMRAYLGREQYGSTPLFYGQYYTAGDPIDAKEGYTKYVRGTDERGRDRYIAKSHAQEFIYRENHCGVFPRMYSNDNGRNHPQFYKYWAGDVHGDRKPDFSQNMRYFNRYQCGWMYWRYFMWNFAGRQNDIQGHHFNDDGTIDYVNGNWICGIKFIDEARLGPQDNLPDHLANNKARNTYFLLPLLLGIFGLIYHFNKDRKGWFIVLIMFFMTGLAIEIYLNMPPRQPRERDYAFVGSFYFFAIWVGLGVMALSDWIVKLLKNEKLHKFVMPAVFVLCFLGVPCLMASENWDDHDRSQKYAARDFAQNYLNSLNKNSVLITFGDNDTFPLWYAQEVEGTRTDVRILNYTLAGMHWYVEQLFNKLYDSDALPFTLPKEYYGLGEDLIYIQDNSADFVEVTDMLNLLKEHPEKFKLYGRDGSSVPYLPTKRFKITLNKPRLVELGVLTPELAAQIPDELRWEISKGALYRHELMMLDIIGTNRFERDINIMSPSYIKSVFPLVDYYAQADGMVYRVLPYPAQTRFSARTADYFINGVDGKKLQWGNLNSDIYVDPVSDNMGTVQRQTFAMLAEDLLKAGDTAKAREILDISDEFFPSKNFARDKYCTFMIPIYQSVYGDAKAQEVLEEIVTYYEQELKYFAQFRGDKARGVRHRMEEATQILYSMAQASQQTLNNPKRAQELLQELQSYGVQLQ